MIADMIDHTLLKADAAKEQILKICEEAREYKFASVCVNPTWVSTAAEALRGSSVNVCTVIGFPLGATTSFAKAAETRDAVANGADEVDMVINVGYLKGHMDKEVLEDVRAVVKAAGGKLVKVIIEAAMLTDEEVVRACKLSVEGGADFVKTSTGFGPGGATVHHVALMRETVGKDIGVKASGGIRDFAFAKDLVKAGANRIGASASIKIMNGDSEKA
ncbi:deoxyribose-phosphate aldolase [bacterium]|nr:deoxyribose-phosphate aldolase [bacterium]